MTIATHARIREPVAPQWSAGQRWGLAVVAALPALLVALAMPLIIDGSLIGFLYGPIVIAVMVACTAVGRMAGLGAVIIGVFVAIVVGPGGYAPESVLISMLLSGSIFLGTWLGQVLVLGPRPAAAAVPALGLLTGALAAGLTDSLEAGVLTAFTGLSLGLLLILIGPWNGDGAVRPARWAEVLTVVTVAIATLATYGVSVSLSLGTPRTVDLFGAEAPQARTDGGVPDPFLTAARWQLDPQEASRVLFTASTSPDAPQNRPTWATFAAYNGISWIAPSTYGVPGDDIPAPEVGAPTDSYTAGTRVTVSVGLTGQWVPVPQRVTQVLSAVATRADPETGIVASVSSPIDNAFDIRYTLAVAERAALRDTTPAISSDLDPAVAIPGPLGGTMAELADLIAEGTDNTWERLTQLSDRLRDPRYSVATPQALAGGLPDRSYAGLNQVLAEGVGFQEQYAAVWALIARSWGVPTRLVIGFPPGEEAPVESVRTVVADEVSIWAEARLTGLGWVAFQASPQDVAAGRPAVVRPLTPDEVPERPEPTPDASDSATPGQSTGADVGTDTATDASTETEPVPAPWAFIFWAFIIAALLVLGAAAWMGYVAWRRRGIRRRLQHTVGPRDGVAGAWRWMRLLLAESWLPLPLSYAPAPDPDHPQDLPDDVAAQVACLARLAGPALYGPGPVTPEVAEEAWQTVGLLDRAIRGVTGGRGAARRLLVPLDPDRLVAPGLARSSQPVGSSG